MYVMILSFLDNYLNPSLIYGYFFPTRFFVRPVEADVQLDKLRDMIDMDSYSKSRTVPAKAIAVGMPVLAVYSEDGQLYRAVVEKIGSKTGQSYFGIYYLSVSAMFGKSDEKKLLINWDILTEQWNSVELFQHNRQL